MSEIARQVYVISDLHLGGVYAEPDDPSGRGFRICTHVPEVTAFVEALAGRPTDGPRAELVINGDMVDFLAEREAAPPHFVPFTPDPVSAVAKLEAIVGRDRPLFDAFGRLLASGRRLTVLLGNHDLELALPAVRQRFRALIGAQSNHDYQFVHDGEAYVVGEALIEHGNRYDKWNVVDNDALRRVRSLQSRRQDVPDKYTFEPPAGSHMVAEVINPIKSEYRFIDLLKPETDGAIPLLLALEPGYRRILGTAVKNGLAAGRHKLEAPALPSIGGDVRAEAGAEAAAMGGDISAMAPGASGPADDPLDEVLADVLGEEAATFASEVGQSVPPPDAAASLGGDISTRDTVDRAVGWAQLLFSKNDANIERRLPALLKAVRALQDDRSFDRSTETYPEYQNAAADLSRQGFEYVLFGHTHLPKDVALDGGARYLNSGTWADLIRFPVEILTGSDAQALDGLRTFTADVAAGRLESWIYFKPTYVRLDLDADDHVVAAQLCDYTTADRL